MNILLVGNYAFDAQQSMLRFADVLERGLTQAGHTVRCIRPSIAVARLWPIPGTLRKWAGYTDKYLLFPLQLRRELGWADVVHVCDQANSLYTRYLNGVPHLVTCHDLLAVRCAKGEFAGQRVGWTGRQYQKMIIAGLNRAEHIACVSEATRRDVERLTNHRNGRLTVVRNGLNHDYQRLPADEAIATLKQAGVDNSRPFFLHVGGNSWYKNRLGAIAIFHELRQHPGMKDFRLIMAGHRWTGEIHRFVREHNLAGEVVESVLPDNDILCALYSTATALLFPSLEEGFGWPVIEAQACGCPVITSNRAPMTEVAGGAAVYIDPEKPTAAAAEIVRRFSDLPAIGRNGMQNARQYSTKQMIEAYLDLYARIAPAKTLVAERSV